MKIRKDKHGLYIRGRFYLKNQGKTNDPAYRPGSFPGYSHVWDTSDAGLTEGENPKTKHVNGEPFIKITLSDGRTAYWGSYNRTEGDFPEDHT